uniref:Aromatic hydrolase n=1 Tax=Sphingobium sp. YW16 TaxID=1165377 RepID=A0A0U2U221_9SPHN|nr:putative aromatic hydrolase [Sphingobium sp. YW16]AQZ39399.1 aromatic hydrolase [Sphingobium sp. YW16]
MAILRVFAAIVVAGSAIPPALAGVSLEKSTVTYRTVDGHDILVDVHRPKGADIRPVIVWLHGGALIMGNREAIIPEIVTLAEEKGYALVSFDYRLAPETKLPAISSDIEAAFAWLGNDGAKRFSLDTKRMIVAGNSAGGYLTLTTGYRVKPKPRALVALYGYGRLNAAWYSQPNLFPEYNKTKITREEASAQYDGEVISDSRRRKGDGGKIYGYYRQNGLWPQEVSGFPPSSIAELIAQYEPAKNVTRDYPPTLLMHGTDDHDVPYEESANMALQFEKHGVPYVLKTIDKGGHGFGGGSPDQIEDAYRSMRDFIVRYLDGE